MIGGWLRSARHREKAMIHSLKAKDQRSYTQENKIETCGLCKVYPCRSRFNVLCLGCIERVKQQIKQQIRVFGPIVGTEE